MAEVACQTDVSDMIFTALSALETSNASIQVGLEVAATQSDVEVLWLWRCRVRQIICGCLLH